MSTSAMTSLLIVLVAFVATAIGNVSNAIAVLGVSESTFTSPSTITRPSESTATVISGNPPGVAYIASLPVNPTTMIRGALIGGSAPDGDGVTIQVSFTGFDLSKAPFSYSINQHPVSPDGDCYATGAVLDPYGSGTQPACSASKPEACPAGDLAGKHGNMSQVAYSASYVDKYLSTTAGSPTFIGNLSMVILDKDANRVACANFAMVGSPVLLSSKCSAVPGSPASVASYTLTPAMSASEDVGPPAGAVVTVTALTTATPSALTGIIATGAVVTVTTLTTATPSALIGGIGKSRWRILVIFRLTEPTGVTSAAGSASTESMSTYTPILTTVINSIPIQTETLTSVSTSVSASVSSQVMTTTMFGLTTQTSTITTQGFFSAVSSVYSGLVHPSSTVLTATTTSLLATSPPFAPTPAASDISVGGGNKKAAMGAGAGAAGLLALLAVI